MSGEPTKPRIAIYGIGRYGPLIAKFAIEKGWPIVAAFNRAGPKVGQDLGRVIGLERDLGVIIQDCETADYDQLDADIGIVTQTDLLHLNLDAYKRLMGAGLNVGCHGGQSYFPFSCNPEIAREIDDLAKKHGVTFTGSGIWDMSRIWSGILVAGPCTEITSLTLNSLTDAHGQTESYEEAKAFCIGDTPEKFYEMGIDKHPVAAALYKTVPENVLMALGYTLTETNAWAEPVVFDEPVKTWFVPEGEFPPGVVVGVRIVTETHTAEGVTAKANIELRLVKEGETEHMEWSVQGTPRNRIRVERDDSIVASAANLFNRIPDIIAAPPGIVPVSQMGPLKTTALIHGGSQ